jgi:hypothetical protein
VALLAVTDSTIDRAADGAPLLVPAITPVLVLKESPAFVRLVF